METIELWERDAELFDGDQALFWAGRMSIAAGMVVRADAMRLFAAIELLNECRERYDGLIFREAGKERPGASRWWPGSAHTE